jgi:hypothetical protein
MSRRKISPLKHYIVTFLSEGLRSWVTYDALSEAQALQDFKTEFDSRTHKVVHIQLF